MHVCRRIGAHWEHGSWRYGATAKRLVYTSIIRVYTVYRPPTYGDLPTLVMGNTRACVRVQAVADSTNMDTYTSWAGLGAGLLAGGLG
jgi:hypothetical protein